MRKPTEAIRCLIVDDERTAAEIIKMHLSQEPDINIVGTCLNASTASKIMSQEKIDLIFLDINMPDMKGTDFAATLDSKVKIIFTTAYRHYAVEGFELQATDYLLKPISKQRILKALDKYREDTAYQRSNPAVPYSASSKILLLKSNRKITKVEVNSIRYIESFGDYIHVNLGGPEIIIRETISSFLEQLDGDFLRVHRSYIVAQKHIVSFSADTIIINTKEIPISRSFKKEVAKALNKI